MSQKALDVDISLAKDANEVLAPILPERPKSPRGGRGPKGRPEAERIRRGLKGWGRRVAAARRRAGLTQVQAAALLGIRQPSLCNLEKGTYPPSEELRLRIEKKLKIAPRAKRG